MPKTSPLAAFLKGSVNVSNTNAPGTSTNVRITRSSRRRQNNEVNETITVDNVELSGDRNNQSVVIMDVENSVLNDIRIDNVVEIIEEVQYQDNNTINLEDSVANRNENNSANNLVEVIEDGHSPDNDTINLEDSVALEAEAQNDEGVASVSVVDLTDGQDFHASFSPPITRRQLPSSDIINVIDLTDSPTPSTSSVLPNVTQPKSSSANQISGCSICLDTYVEIKDAGKTIVSTTCGHVFCDTCLQSSLKNNGSQCPVCRKKLRKGDYHPIYL